MDVLILFDVDATLLLTHRAGVRCMERAGAELLGDGFSLSNVTVGGGMDEWLFFEAAKAGGFEPTEALHEQFKERYRAHLSEELASAPKRPHTLPGVPELVEQVHAHDRLTLGVLTGNYAATGKLKLASVGLEESWFQVQAWSDGAPDRPSLVVRAMEQFETLRGRPPEPHQVIVIGDTPRDAHCANAHGCPCLGVATGTYSEKDLADAGAAEVVADLTNTDPFWRLVEAGLAKPADPA